MKKVFWITEAWLRSHSANGDIGWTAGQLRVLGVTWPPRRGWMRALVGCGIEQAQKDAFEAIGKAHREKREVAHG